MLPCMSRRVAPTLNATGPKKEASFCKKPCLASMDPLSVCVCMLALVVAVLIAYDYECGRKLSASLFLGSQNQAFLASWLWALIVYIYNIFQMGGKKQPPGKPLLKQNGCFPKSWYPKMDGENHGSNQTL